MNELTCPECGDPLNIGEEWRLIKPWKEGTTVAAGESIQGDYAHARCV